MTIERGLGWLPDVPRHTDYTEAHPEIAPLLARTAYATMAPAAAPALAVSVDLSGRFSPVEDQGSLGSCTANAAVGLLEYFERRAFLTHIDASRLFVYKASRNLLGWTGDTGAYLRSAMGALTLFGAPPEKYWPYDGRPAASNPKFDVEPPAFCYAFGANYQATKYFRLDPNGASAATTLANVRRFLAAGFPSMFGFPVFSEFDNPLPGGLIAFPGPTSQYRGGHAIVAVGYDDNKMVGVDKGALLVRNSWGTTWANAGYGWLSYRYVTEGLAVDWWSLIAARWADTGKF